MRTNQPNKPLLDHRLPAPSPWPSPLVESDKPTVELTDDEIMAFGTGRGGEVRAGHRLAHQSR